MPTENQQTGGYSNRSRSRSARRRRAGARNNKKVSIAVPQNRQVALISSQSDPDHYKSVVKMRKAVGSSSHVSDIVTRVVNWAKQSNPLSAAGEIFFHRMANPCGEVTDPVRGVDGALQTSGSWDLRGVATLVPPWLNESTTSSSLNNWGWYAVIPPFMRTVCFIIASRKNTEPSRAKQAIIWQTINNATEAEFEWPLWLDVDGDFVVSLLTFDGLDLDIDTDSSLSRVFEAMRWIGNGLVIEHNCPKFYDQGTLVATQFASNSTVVNTTSTRLDWQIEVILKQEWATPAQAYPITCKVTGTDPKGNVLVIGSATIASAGSSGTVNGFVPTFVATPYGVASALLPNGATSFPVFVPGTQYQFRFSADNLPSAINVTFQPQPIVGTGSVNAPFTPGSGTVLRVSFPVLISLVTNQAPIRNVNCWVPPDLSTKALAQQDPKFWPALMASKKGIYHVSHLQQPVMKVKNVVDAGRVKVLHSLLSEQAVVNSPGGPLDVIDPNFCTSVIAIRGISYAAQPFMHFCRTIEAVVTPGSAFSVMMAKTPIKDEDAMNAAQAFCQTAPHSYPPAMNFLGGLMSLVAGVITAIPTGIRFMGSLSKGIAWACEKAEEHLLPAAEAASKWIGPAA